MLLTDFPVVSRLICWFCFVKAAYLAVIPSNYSILLGFAYQTGAAMSLHRLELLPPRENGEQVYLKVLAHSRSNSLTKN